MLNPRRCPRRAAPVAGLVLSLSLPLSISLLGGPGGPPPVHAAPDKNGDRAVVTRSLPSERGVRSEAEAVVDAPAEHVASLLAEPANFVPLFPAERIEVLKSSPARQVVSIEMRKPWPVGTVRWVEEVTAYRDSDGKAYVVERNAQGGGYFRQMRAVWRVTPHPDSEQRCVVTYQVLTELTRWVPEWALRKGNLSGIVETMGRLRKLVAEKPPTEAGSAPDHQ